LVPPCWQAGGSLPGSIAPKGRPQSGNLSSPGHELAAPRLEEILVKAKRSVDALRELLDKVFHGLRVVEPRGSVWTDRVLLTQILENVITNALRYTDRGGVLLACRRRGPRVHIQVWDTGIGIPDEQLESVFLEFHRVRPASGEADGGLGLGLSIVRRLPVLFDHPVRIRSRVGRGTMFEVVVPGAAGADAVEQELAADPGQEIIALLDDDSTVIDSLTTLLQIGGYQVVADTGIEALCRRIRQEEIRPAVLISDYNLGEGSTGTEALDTLRRRFGRSLPAIILTGDSSFQRLRERSGGGGYRVLAKPVEATTLLQELRRCLSERRQPNREA
jgi:CheY-like chemotaxis protein/anti-sigma regulatory factor (Ser/Thr protein kinase)